MSKTVADQFADTLTAAGIKRIYGMVGDSLNGLTDAIRRQKKIERNHVRLEEVAAFADRADAHLTGELAVCALRGKEHVEWDKATINGRTNEIPDLAKINL
jgi:pyruvate dehydrogenase (quinone)